MKEAKRGDGYGIVRFNKRTRQITLECWPRFSNVKEGDEAQFPGWPVTINMDENDGRKPLAWLPEITVENAKNPVIQVIADKSGEILYTVRVQGSRFQPAVYAPGDYTVKVGQARTETEVLKNVEAKPKAEAGKKTVIL